MFPTSIRVLGCAEKVQAILAHAKPAAQRRSTVRIALPPRLGSVRVALVPDAHPHQGQTCLLADCLQQLSDLRDIVVPHVQHAVRRQHALALLQPADAPWHIAGHLVPCGRHAFAAARVRVPDVVGRICEHQVAGCIRQLAQPLQHIAMETAHGRCAVVYPVIPSHVPAPSLRLICHDISIAQAGCDML